MKTDSFKTKLLPLADCIFIVVFCSVVIGVYKLKNGNGDAERYYHKHARHKYVAMVSCYTLIMFAFWLHLRYFLSSLLSQK